LAEPSKPAPSDTSKNTCEPKEISRFRNSANDAAVISYDLNCSGKANANYIVPDKKTDAILMTGTETVMAIPMLSFLISSGEVNGTSRFGMQNSRDGGPS
jgi:hypothetical protein